MAATKRAYKLQEFVAHSSNVNCLRIGRKTSRVVVTGGEDHKVNLWSIGKPNAILSLSGHTSAIESVCFDSSEVLVAAGAASGTIKLWDLEEAKIVRNLTGHRSNCISVDFHPFGEFFASGSLDTNLKIWDIRQKECIHTYKGHTRGVNTIRFTPDGRWVISGGEDNVVKLWDLTAGKLMHDFKSHEGQIQCIDFHPHEFLLATGSADKTVKFWDLETFELIGSAGPETTGVRSITFNPDGRTLLCGLHESLKVFSWEPVGCHDTVDVGWSRLSDLNIHEGKLLGCSYNQSCVGVWVVDISQIQPYAIASVGRSNSRSDSKSFSASLRVQDDNNIITSAGRLSLSQNPESATTEAKTTASSRSAPSTPQRNGISTNPKVTSVNSTPSINTTVKRSSTKTRGATNPQKFSKSDEASVIVPRTSLRMEAISESKRVNDASFTTSDVVPVIVPRSSSRPELTSESQRNINFELKLTNFLKLSNAADSDRSSKSMRSGYTGCKNNESDEDKPDAGSVIVPRTSSRVEAISASERDSGASSNKSDVVPVIVPRTSSRMELASESKRNIKFELKLTNFQKLSVASDLDRSSKSMHSGYTGSKNNESDEDEDMKFVSCADGFNGPASAGERAVDDFRCVRPIKIGDSRFMGPSTNYHDENYDIQVHKPRLACSVGAQKGGRTRSLAASWERDGQSPIIDNLQQQQEQPRQQQDRQQQRQQQQQSDPTPTARMPYMMTETNQRARRSSAEVEAVSTSDEDTISDLMEQHKQFINSAQSRLTKLQVVHRLWKRKDIRGLISAMEKMSDHAVSADIISILIEKSDIVTLDTCTILLPLLTSLLGSNMDRHLGVSVEMLLKLVRIFGPVIHSSISAAPSVGVDLQAEQRLDRCNMCFIELEKVKHIIPHLTRRGGSIAKSTQELNLALQEVI